MIIFLFLLTGCDLGNTPTARVEDLLSKHQMLDKDVSYNYMMLSSQEVSSELQEQYRELIRHQYRNLSYEIKDEEIDGDNAVVTVEVKVLDYIGVLGNYDIEPATTEDVHERLIRELEDVKEYITYTIEFELYLDDETWVVKDLDTEVQEKLLGIYFE